MIHEKAPDKNIWQKNALFVFAHEQRYFDSLWVPLFRRSNKAGKNAETWFFLMRRAQDFQEKRFFFLDATMILLNVINPRG